MKSCLYLPQTSKYFWDFRKISNKFVSSCPHRERERERELSNNILARSLLFMNVNHRSNKIKLCNKLLSITQVCTIEFLSSISNYSHSKYLKICISREEFIQKWKGSNEINNWCNRCNGMVPCFLTAPITRSVLWSWGKSYNYYILYIRNC